MRNKTSKQFSAQGNIKRKIADQRRNSPEQEITFASVRKSIHLVLNTIKGGFYCGDFPNCDDLK